MKILHLMLSNYYIDNVTYQENLLTRQNMMDGYVVKIVASTETFVSPNRLGYVKPSTYINKDGIEVTRIPYRKILPLKVMAKIRSYSGLYNIIEAFKPDVILHHGVPSYELLTLGKYKKRNPQIKLYLDSHEDFHNSARNYFSKEILHRRFYGPIVRRILKYIDKIFYITYETKIFLKEMYNIEEEKMEFYPLGGYIFSEEERNMKRTKIRKQLGLREEDVLLVHSGKLTAKKRTNDLIEALIRANTDNLRLVIIGSIPDEQKAIKDAIQKDNRISYLGWKNPDELLEYLCACDLYVQPGSQSATMQNALCCGSTAMLYPHKSHKHLLGDSVFYIETIDDMVKVFEDILEDRELLEEKRLQSYKIAKEKLDYKILASRLYR